VLLEVGVICGKKVVYVVKTVRDRGFVGRRKSTIILSSCEMRRQQ
jgi:hypothetical protein